jgi:hypothetical protein
LKISRFWTPHLVALKIDTGNFVIDRLWIRMFFSRVNKVHDIYYETCKNNNYNYQECQWSNISMNIFCSSVTTASKWFENFWLLFICWTWGWRWTWVQNLDIFNINLFQVFYFITIMLFVSNTIPIDLSVIYFNNIKSVIYCIIIVVILVVNIPRFNCCHLCEVSSKLWPFTVNL